MDSTDTHAAPESKLHFLDYWRIIRIRKAIIIFVFVITTVIASVTTFLLPPRYSSTAQIEIQPDVTTPDPVQYTQYDPYFMETELDTLKGDVVLSRVVEDLNLAVEWGKKMSPDGQPLKTTEVMDYLRKDLSLDSDRNTKLIDINVENEDKELAARLANRIADDYKDYRLEVHSNQMAVGIAKLQDQYQGEENEIRQMHNEVDQLRKKDHIRDIDPS